jgi:hypothetical protein
MLDIGTCVGQGGADGSSLNPKGPVLAAEIMPQTEIL